MKILILAFIVIEVFSENCRILSFQSAGTRGVYEIGAIKAFFDLLNSKDIDYDIFEGVSAGSITSVAISMFPKGDEKNAIEYGKEIWIHIKMSEMMKNWENGGILNGLLFHSGIFDSSPGYNFVKSQFTKIGYDIKRNVTIGTTDYDRNQFINIGMNLTNENVLDWVMASSAIPFAFPVRNINFTNYVDGGALYRIDFLDSINFCRNKGFQDKDIIVDAIMADAMVSQVMNATKFSSTGMVERAKQFQKRISKKYQLNDTFFFYPEINYRYIVIPDHDFLGEFNGVIHLDTNPKHLQEAYELGYNDSVKTIKRKNNISK